MGSNMIIFFIILISSLVSIASGDDNYLGHKCASADKTYTKNSAYSTNLKNLLSDLKSNTPSNQGFRTTTSGNDPDRVYGLALCRGDVPSNACSDCMNTVTTDITAFCKDSRQAIYWRDNCYVKYSNNDFFRVIDFELKFSLSGRLVSRDKVYNAAVVGLLQDLTRKATDQTASRKMFAYGNAYDRRIYGLVQCSGDLSKDNCKNCVDRITKELPTSSEDGNTYIYSGGRVITGSCSIRYERYDFTYNPDDNGGD